jgi:hypothetical protein
MRLTSGLLRITSGLMRITSGLCGRGLTLSCPLEERKVIKIVAFFSVQAHLLGLNLSESCE